MEFVFGLPRSLRRNDRIWVIVDRLSKSAHFLPIRSTDGPERLAKMYGLGRGEGSRCGRGRGRGRGHGRGRGGRGKDTTNNVFTPLYSSKSLSYLEDFPSFLKPYIQGWLDVESDGHCGFRVVAHHVYDDQDSWMRVRQELFFEIDARPELYEKIFMFNTTRSIREALSWWDLSSRGTNWWMDADMGYMIATRYNKLFVILSASNPQTYLPLRKEESIDVILSL
ncbi:hypothetical protein LIER_35690 [Lithospermum erythrorhizon]|uniref:Uncharacterized protein n=1 Tax=Lithospermum erythrorhizon TaxID=34254 RepID=A0AAV3NV92_LITER